MKKNCEPVSSQCSGDNNAGLAYYQDLALSFSENTLIQQESAFGWLYDNWDLCYEEAHNLLQSDENFGALQLNNASYDCFYFSRPISGISYQEGQILGIRCSDSPHCHQNGKKIIFSIFHNYYVLNRKSKPNFR